MYLPLNFSVNLKLFKKKVIFPAGVIQSVLYMSVRSSWFLLLFKYSVLFFIFCLDVLH